jgi:hypothetical protein
MDENRFLSIDQMKKIEGHLLNRDGNIRISFGPFRTK